MSEDLGAMYAVADSAEIGVLERLRLRAGLGARLAGAGATGSPGTRPAPAPTGLWRATWKVEVLCDDDPPASFAGIPYAIEEGPFVGRAQEVLVEVLSRERMGELLRAFGSDPAFFGLD